MRNITELRDHPDLLARIINFAANNSRQGNIVLNHHGFQEIDNITEIHFSGNDEEGISYRALLHSRGFFFLSKADYRGKTPADLPNNWPKSEDIPVSAFKIVDFIRELGYNVL